MRSFLVCSCLVLPFSFYVMADGPADRKPTDPHAVTSGSASEVGPLPVEALLTSNRTVGFTASRDGRTLAYIASASGRPNLWTMKADGSNARQLVKNNDYQMNARFTPDNSALVYSQDRGGNEYYDIYKVPANGGEPQNLTHTDDISEIVDRFSPDGKLLSMGIKRKTFAATDIAVLDWSTGAAHQLTHETDPKATWGSALWSPDSRFLYAARRINRDDSDIFRIEVATGHAEKLFEHSGKELVSLADVSPDGKSLLLTSDEKGGYANVALLDLAMKKLRWVTDTQWSADAGGFTPDGNTVVYTLNADGRVSIHFLNLKSMNDSDRGIPVGMNFPSGAPSSFLRDGSMLVTHQDSSHPAEVFRLAPDNKLTQITHNANEALQHAVLPSSQLVTYRSFDGQMISAFVWVPFNLRRDGTAPAVVMPHGGPTGQTTDAFNGRAELLASRGFVVIAPNVRGSTGYGMAFEKLNIKDLGGADLKDEIAGVDFLEATGFIDKTRVGIWGGSYGGYMTLMAIGKAPGVWAAAVDEYGILNWLTMLEHEDPSLQAYEKMLLGDPVKERAIYEASSPLKYIRNETAPLLVLQGENDIRVPKEEAEQVVEILKSEGRTVDVVFYPEEGHGFAKREHQQDELTRSVAWLQKYLQPAPADR